MKEARLSVGLSQRRLGIDAGIDEAVASVRINRYELGVHSPDYLTAKRIATALNVPLPFLFCEDDDLCKLIVLFANANQATKSKALKVLG